MHQYNLSYLRVPSYLEQGLKSISSQQTRFLRHELHRKNGFIETLSRCVIRIVESVSTAVLIGLNPLTTRDYCLSVQNLHKKLIM